MRSNLGKKETLIRRIHQKFSDIKNYYNDITLNNLSLINTLKEQIEKNKKKEDQLEKNMSEVMVSYFSILTEKTFKDPFS